MKLTIEHLAKHLPYGLYVGSPIGNAFLRGIVNGAPNMFSIIKGYQAYWYDIEYCVPCLHPLSDLAKPIGDKIVMFDILTQKEKESLTNITLPARIDEVCYSASLKLLKYHFDIDGLIDACLAVDVNTLDRNPYK